MMTLDTYNLEEIERTVCTEVFNKTKSVKDAADLLGLSRHAARRRFVKYGLMKTSVLEDSEESIK